MQGAVSVYDSNKYECVYRVHNWLCTQSYIISRNAMQKWRNLTYTPGVTLPIDYLLSTQYDEVRRDRTPRSACARHLLTNPPRYASSWKTHPPPTTRGPPRPSAHHHHPPTDRDFILSSRSSSWTTALIIALLIAGCILRDAPGHRFPAVPQAHHLGRRQGRRRAGQRRRDGLSDGDVEVRAGQHVFHL